MTPELVELLINRPRGIAALEIIELSHPMWPERIFILRNYVRGGELEITLETSEVVTASFVPATIQWAKSKTNMDQVFNVAIQDLNELVQTLENAVPLENEDPIICRMRVYTSDNLSAPAEGPIELEVTTLDYDKSGCKFQASPITSNETGSGERYTVNRFPMLRGFTRPT